MRACMLALASLGQAGFQAQQGPMQAFQVRHALEALVPLLQQLRLLQEASQSLQEHNALGMTHLTSTLQGGSQSKLSRLRHSCSNSGCCRSLPGPAGLQRLGTEVQLLEEVPSLD